MFTTSGIFDTLIDTRKLFVPMQISIVKRKYINKDGKSQLYLHVTSLGNRERVPLDIYIYPKYWQKKLQTLKGPAQDCEIENLLIDNVKAKVSKIRTFYKLSYKDLTIHGFLSEFKNNLPRANFVSFYRHMLEDRRNTIEASTYGKELAVLKKLMRYREEVLFYEIDKSWFQKYRNHLARLGNKNTTRNGNIKIIKKYLRFAVDAGVKLSVNMNDIKTGSTAGNKGYLDKLEIKKLYSYYFSEFIADNERLAIGYFLFGCFTGLRHSDIVAQKREALLSGSFTFRNVKTKKMQFTKLNAKAKAIISRDEQLFVKTYTNNTTRNLVKRVCETLHIQKTVDFHMSRHSFGTNYILLGGDVTKLKILMNHSDIKETMVYVHLAEMEKNAEADLLDEMF